MVKIAIVIYSTYGHILTLSKAEAEGVKAAGAHVDIFQLPSGEQNDASASSGLPVITPSKLGEYDGVLFGIPSRYGTHPYAFKAFLDATGAQWASGTYYGKYAGFFVSTGTQGGGQESVIRNSVTVLAHHGFLYVPLGYARAFGEITNLAEVHGGSPWGAGTIAGPSGSRQPSQLELQTARIQGKSFAETVARGLGEHLSGSSHDSAAGVGLAAGGAGAGAVAGATAASGTTATSNSASAGPTSTAPTSTAGAASSDLDREAAKARLDEIGPGSAGAADIATNEPSKATAVEKNAKSAPEKAEKAEKNTEQATKQEKDGCCKCM